MGNNTRYIIFNILNDLFKSNKSLNIIFNQYLSDSLKRTEKNFIINITKGILRHKYALDKNINFYSKKKPDPKTRLLLYIGIYQIIFCNSIPNYASVDTTTELASKISKHTKNFINAILRKICDNSLIIDKNTINYNRNNCSKWLYGRLLSSYNKQDIINYLKISSDKPKIWLRINKDNKYYIQKKLRSNNITFYNDKIFNIYFYVDQFDDNNIIIDFIKKGFLYVQNPSSGFVVKYLEPLNTDNILDACCAPGGKSSLISFLTGGLSKIDCNDIDNDRLKLTQSNFDRMNISNINFFNYDLVQKKLLNNNYDKILLDVPCSSSGTIQKNPDIKWKFNKDQLYTFKNLQLSILNNISKYLNRGSEIVYSTCSLLKEENEDNIIEFLKKNRNFEVVEAADKSLKQFKNKIGGITILPSDNFYEGMFAIKLKKNA